MHARTKTFGNNFGIDVSKRLCLPKKWQVEVRKCCVKRWWIRILERNVQIWNQMINFNFENLKMRSQKFAARIMKTKFLKMKKSLELLFVITM